MRIYLGKKPFSFLVLLLLVFVSANTTADALEDAKDLFYKKNYAKAKPLFYQSKACCEGEAVYFLARITEQEHAPNSQSNALKLYRDSAGKGYGASMSTLANKYASGDGVEVSLLKATDWSRRAKEAERQKTIVDIITFDDEQAPVETWKFKAKQGDVEAMYRLARIYDDGILDTHNVSLAAQYYQQAANLGHAESQFMIGYFYCRGIGVSKDINKANQWITAYKTDLSCH